MPAWYEDDAFWTTFYPAMFHERRWEIAGGEIDAVVTLLGINLNSSKDGKLWARSAWNHRFHRTLGARSYTPPSVSRHVGLPSAFMSWFSCRSCVSGCGVLSNQG